MLYALVGCALFVVFVALVLLVVAGGAQEGPTKQGSGQYAEQVGRAYGVNGDTVKFQEQLDRSDMRRRA
jgi:hypothetical protein